MRKNKSLFLAALIISGILLHAAPAICAGSAAPAPYAILTATRNEKTGDVAMDLVVKGAPGAHVAYQVAGGVEKLDRFDKWYEDLFGLAYLGSDYKSMWKKLRDRGALLAGQFMTPEALDALKGARLLVVVDKDRPFPADVFRVGDKWLWETVPIVHSLSAGPKDLSDTHHYKTILVVDCQGPKDREGLEAPGVDANLAKIPGIKHQEILSLKRDETIKNLEGRSADVIHLATHAHPDEFFPGRNKPGIPASKMAKMRLRYRTFLSTGCNTGNPIFSRGVLHGDVKFFIASMYVTSGKDGIAVADVFYRALFSGKTPYEAFYAVKDRIAGNKSDFPDALRFVFYVK